MSGVGPASIFRIGLRGTQTILQSIKSRFKHDGEGACRSRFFGVVNHRSGTPLSQPQFGLSRAGKLDKVNLCSRPIL